MGVVVRMARAVLPVAVADGVQEGYRTDRTGQDRTVVAVVEDSIRFNWIFGGSDQARDCLCSDESN